MNILSVDTATRGMSVSVLGGGHILTKTHDNMRDQAGMLLPLIVGALKEAQLDFEVLDALVVAIGPGSFTGIRVGLSAMQGISLAANKLLVGFNSFEIYASAHNCSDDEDGMLVVLESHRSEAFCQLYDISGNIYGKPFQTDAKNIKTYLPDWKNLSVVGNASAMLQELNICQGYQVKSIKKTSKEKYGSEVLGTMLLDMLKNNTLDNIAKKYLATPFYIRPPDITISKKNIPT